MDPESPKPKLYITAMFAYNAQLDPGRLSMNVSPGCVVGFDMDECRKIGLERFREMFQESDGWYGHTIHITEAPIVEILAVMAA